MNKSTKLKLLAILMFFVMAITLGGLGTIAVKDHFYWVAFIANVGVYVAIIHKLFKKGKK